MIISLILYVLITTMNWPSILIGASIGAFIGLGISELIRCIRAYNFREKCKNYFAPYCHNWNLSDKSNSENTRNITLQHFKENILTLDYFNDNGIWAKGKIIMDKNTLMIGQGIYYNTNDDKQSGFIEIMLINENLIHSKQSYIAIKERKEILTMFIWSKR